MRKSEKIIILVIVLAIIFSVITVIVIRTVRLFQKSTQSFCSRAKNLILFFNKALKHEKSLGLRPQDDKEQPNSVILSVSEESHFHPYLTIKDEDLQLIASG
jgi:hypothetical protein